MSCLPLTYPFPQAVSAVDADEKKEAIQADTRDSIASEAWDIIGNRENAKIKCRIVFKSKYKTDGTIESREARLEVKRFVLGRKYTFLTRMDPWHCCAQ